MYVQLKFKKFQTDIGCFISTASFYLYGALMSLTRISFTGYTEPGPQSTCAENGQIIRTCVYMYTTWTEKVFSHKLSLLDKYFLKLKIVLSIHMLLLWR